MRFTDHALAVPLQDLAGNLERARAKVKPPTKGSKGGRSPGGGSEDEDDATAQELGLTAEVRRTPWPLCVACCCT